VTSNSNTSMTEAVRSWPRSSFSTRAAISLLDSINSRMRTKVSDDGDTHLDGAIAAQDRREHGNPFLGEYERGLAASPTFADGLEVAPRPSIG
jgi:hypothetical protein